MRWPSTRFRVLAVLAILCIAQLHGWAEFDQCLWRPNQTHRSPAPGSHHGVNDHACQVSFSGGWVIVCALPSLEVALRFFRLEAESPRASSKICPADLSAPRAPPHA